MATSDRTLDPVTFEVLKNSFVTVVDEMAEQILRTCHSFVIFSRDFSCALHDARGDTIMQGSQDIAVHVGTLHLKAKAVLEDFEGDIHEGDVFAINDPYRGGTHFPDVSLIRPVFADGELIALAQANGHWADVGGSVPGSFDVTRGDGHRSRLAATRGRLGQGVLRGLRKPGLYDAPGQPATDQHPHGRPGRRPRHPSQRPPVRRLCHLVGAAPG